MKHCFTILFFIHNLCFCTTQKLTFDDVTIEQINKEDLFLVNYGGVLDHFDKNNKGRKQDIKNVSFLYSHTEELVGRSLRNGDGTNLKTQKLNENHTLKVQLDPCVCDSSWLKFRYKNSNEEKRLLNFFNPLKIYFEDHLNDTVCVSSEEELILNNNNDDWILNCIKRIDPGQNYTQDDGMVKVEVEKCAFPITVSYTSLPDCTVETTTSTDTTTSTTSTFSETVLGFVTDNSKWFLLAIILTAIIVLVSVSLVCCIRRGRKVESMRQKSVFNPMYGIDQDYGYYMDSKIEETNPQYDSYYKVTDDNDTYGNETQ